MYEDDGADGGLALWAGAKVLREEVGGVEVISEKCGGFKRRGSSKTISSSGSDSMAWYRSKEKCVLSLAAESGELVWDTVTVFGQGLPDQGWIMGVLESGGTSCDVGKRGSW